MKLLKAKQAEACRRSQKERRIPVGDCYIVILDRQTRTGMTQLRYKVIAHPQIENI